MSNLSLNKQTPHDYEKALLGKKIRDNEKAQVPTYYDAQAFYVAPRRDDIHVPMFKLKSPKKIGEGFGGYYKTP